MQYSMTVMEKKCIDANKSLNIKNFVAIKCIDLDLKRRIDTDRAEIEGLTQ